MFSASGKTVQKTTKKLLITAFEQNTDGLALADARGVIRFVNGAWLQMHGCDTAEESTGLKLDMFSWPDGFPHVCEHINNKGMYSCEISRCAQDGSSFSAWINVTRIKDERGATEGFVIALRNSTERRLLIRQLQEKSAFMQNIFQSSGEGIIVTDEQGHITLCNQRAAGMLGYELEEMQGKHFVELAHGHFQTESNTPSMEQLYAQGFIFNHETILVRKDASLFPAELNVVLLKNDSGGIIGATSSIRDITERKRMTEALKKRTLFLEKIFLTTGEGILVTDAHGYLVRANLMAQQMFMCNESELTGRQFFELGDESYSSGAKPAGVEQLLENGSVRNYETRYRRKDGTFFFAENNVVLLRDELGEIIGAITSIRDITERRQAEQALAESEAKYRSIFNNVQDVFYQTDLEGTIIEISPSVERYSGYLRDELIGVQTGMVFYETPEGRARFLSDLQEKKELFDYEMSLRVKDGSIKYASVNAHFIYDAGNQPVGIEGFMRDITERKHAELALKDRDAKLQAKAGELETVNSALKVLLNQTEAAKKELEEKVLFNVQELVVSHIEKLRRTALNDTQKAYITILKSNLENITSSFGQKLSVNYAAMTQAEIQIANFIREGKTTKEMSDLLCVSERTVDFHRKNIRNKLGISNQKANLRSVLLSLQ